MMMDREGFDGFQNENRLCSLVERTKTERLKTECSPIGIAYYRDKWN
jgi:hypothetical protein